MNLFALCRLSNIVFLFFCLNVLPQNSNAPLVSEDNHWEEQEAIQELKDLGVTLSPEELEKVHEPTLPVEAAPISENDEDEDISTTPVTLVPDDHRWEEQEALQELQDLGVALSPEEMEEMSDPAVISQEPPLYEEENKETSEDTDNDDDDNDNELLHSIQDDLVSLANDHEATEVDLLDENDETLKAEEDPQDLIMGEEEDSDNDIMQDAEVVQHEDSQDEELDEPEELVAESQPAPSKPSRYSDKKRKMYPAKATAQPQSSTQEDSNSLPEEEDNDDEKIEVKEDGQEITLENETTPDTALQEAEAITAKEKANVVIKPPSIPMDYDQAEQILNKAYTNKNTFVSIADEEKEAINQSGGNPTYGEITPAAMKRLLIELNFDNTDIFMSLGSGGGREVLYVALASPAKAVGVELSETRHNLAREAKKSIEREQGISIGRKAIFVNKNILDLRNIRKATIVYISNLCFSDKFMEKMIKKFEKLKDGALIITVGKQLPPRLFYRLVRTYNLPMTWSESTPVYLYEVTKKTIAKRSFLPLQV